MGLKEWFFFLNACRLISCKYHSHSFSFPPNVWPDGSRKFLLPLLFFLFLLTAKSPQFSQKHFNVHLQRADRIPLFGKQLAISSSFSPCQAPSSQNLENGVRIERGKGERRAENREDFSFKNHSLEFKVLQNSRMQDAEHADHGLFAA